MPGRHTSRIGAILLLTPVLGLAQHGGMGGGGGMGAGAPMSMPAGGPGMSGQMASGSQMGQTMSAQAERRMHAEALQRAHPDLLALDPHGNLMIREEIVALGASDEALAAAQAAGFSIRRNVRTASLETDIVVLGVPRGMAARKALQKARAFDANAAFDFNHIYDRSGAVTGPENPNGESNATMPIAGATDATQIGLIDGGVDPGHTAFHSVTIHAHGCDGRAIPSSHGTAVASRIVTGFSDVTSPPPRVDLYAADVYCGEPTGGSIDAIIGGIAWLLEQKVPVINVSLVGPPNALLERIVASTIARGHLIVAAVGNDGPSAPALYPAAYPGVIAVTGVDHSDRVLMEAGRGKFLSFSAPGADVEAASLPDGFSGVRGTSFAAPIVASRLARLLRTPDRAAAERAVNDLAATALDLGSPGRDSVYGIGCIGCTSVARPEHVSR